MSNTMGCILSRRRRQVEAGDGTAEQLPPRTRIDRGSRQEGRGRTRCQHRRSMRPGRLP